MTPQEAAAALDGNQYTKEGSKELFAAMKAAGLVALFGASDDLMEFRGAIDDEVDCYNGGFAFIVRGGLLKSECDEGDNCPYFRIMRDGATSIQAHWCPEPGVFRGYNELEPWWVGEPSWVYSTDIPHARFQIMENGNVYCVGLVFRLVDAAEMKPHAEVDVAEVNRIARMLAK